MMLPAPKKSANVMKPRAKMSRVLRVVMGKPKTRKLLHRCRPTLLQTTNADSVRIR